MDRVRRRNVLQMLGTAGSLGVTGCSGLLRESGGNSTPSPASGPTASPTPDEPGTLTPADTETSTPDDPDTPTPEGTLRLVVDVPENTPSTADIYVEIRQPSHFEAVAMTQMSEYRYQANLSLDVFEPEPGEEGPVLVYRYNRNNRDFYTTEYLEPDTPDYYWTELGRSVRATPGWTQEDTVARWRWFPDGPLETTTARAPESEWQPRAEGQFHSGQVLEDLYVPSFRPFFDRVANHMADVGYRTAVLEPPWQWIAEDPPRVGNGLVETDAEPPNYPDNETLLAHVEAFQNAGLEVILGPQICCNGIDLTERSTGWWDTYFEELSRFLVHFAELAQQAGVSAFFYPIGSQATNAPLSADEIDAKYRDIWADVRDAYDGPLGQAFWNLGAFPDAGAGPTPEYVTWGDVLDFGYYLVDAPLVREMKATDAQLRQGAAEILDEAKIYPDTYDWPIYVQTAYFGVEGSWRGGEYYSIASVPGPGGSEAALADSKYSRLLAHQERTLDAYFEAASSRPWIQGLFQFGYSHWQYPLAADLSIHGKPIEDLWRKWNEHIYGT